MKPETLLKKLTENKVIFKDKGYWIKNKINNMYNNKNYCIARVYKKGQNYVINKQTEFSNCRGYIQDCIFLAYNDKAYSNYEYNKKVINDKYTTI